MRGLLVLVWAASAGVASAAIPTLEAVFPAGGQAGSEFDLRLHGKLEPWPCEVWCSNPSIQFVPDAEKTGHYRAKIAGEVEPGAYLLRVVNKEGASAPRVFVVGAAPEAVEPESGNNDLSTPMDLGAPPAMVNGCLAKGGQVDFFRVAMKAGQKIPIWLDGHSLRSPIDPHLHIYSADGTRLALANDRPGGLDPEIEFEVPADGEYTVAVMAFVHPPSSNVSFSGNANSVYRLAIGGEGRPGTAGDIAESPPGERELPIRVGGSIPETGGSSRYRFGAKKGQKLWFEVEASSLASPLDAVLRIEKEDGGLIKEIDDTKTSPDPEYLWSVPADGAYEVTVSDRFRRGGDAFRFQLEVAEAQPDFSVAAKASEFVLKRGESVEVELEITRLHGHAQELEVKFQGLPEGVSAELPEIPEKGGTVKIKCSAAKEASPSSGPLRIEVLELGGEDDPRSRTAVFPFEKTAPYGAYLIEETDALWLTVTE